MDNTKDKIKEATIEMLTIAHQRAVQDIDRVLASGCIDTEAGTMPNAKAISIALLENAAMQYVTNMITPVTRTEVRNIQTCL